MAAALARRWTLNASSKVATTSVLSFSAGRVSAGLHKLAIRITGANPRARQSRIVGLDYVRLTPAKRTQATESN